MSSVEDGSRRRGRMRLERWLPQLVVSPIFALSLFFVYGFIAWTVYISFTKSRMMPVYDFIGLAQYERLWATPRWYVALDNLFIFGGLFIAGCLIIGLMLESNLNPGNQKLCEDLSELQYGVSITDACIGWEETESLILRYAQQMVDGVDWRIDRRWQGVYTLLEDREILETTIDGHVHLVTGIGGKGMTTAPAVARESIERHLAIR